MSIDNQDDQSPKERKTPGRFSGPGLVLPLLILAVIAGYMYVLGSSPKKISYKQFIDQLRAQNVAQVNLFKGFAIGEFREPVAAEASEKSPAKKSPAVADEKAKSPETKSAEIKSSANKSDQKPDLRFSVLLPER